MKTLHKRSALASSIALAAMMGAGHAAAQENQAAPQLEEVLVQGIKQSLEQAQDFKRNSVGVVDAISAEGLGKFPDSNIAESLQRIPGVSIDRNSGEGQFVTVRGFGPSFNTVLVNGRRVVSETGGREFSFDLYPAELITGAEIYKSGKASLQEGGIGATINLKTARPLDMNEDKILLTAKGLLDEDSGETTPQVFGLFSKIFNGGDSAFLTSVSYQERKSQEDFSNTNGWLPTDINAIPLASDGNPNPGNVDTAFIPRETQTGRRLQTRERLNIQAVFQHDLNDRLRFTVDGFYNEFDVESSATMLGSWFGDPGAISNVVLNENGSVLTQDISSEVGILNRLEGRPTETKAIGFNLDWAPADELQTIFDLSYSESEALQGKGNGQAVMGFTDDYSFDNRGSVAEVVYPESVQQKIVNRDSYTAHVAQFGDQAGDGTGGNSVSGNVYEIKLDNIYTPDRGGYLKDIKFGVSYSEEQKTVDVVRPAFDVFCLYCFFNIDVPNDLLMNFDTSNLLSGVAPNTQKDFFTFDLRDYIGWQSSPEGFAALDEFVANGGTPAVPLPDEFSGYQEFYESQPGGYVGTRQPDSYEVEEKIFAAYTDITLEGESAGFPWVVNSGLRWILTDTEAVGSQQVLERLAISDPDATQYQTSFSSEGSGFQSEKNDYLTVLPNLSLSVDVTDNLVARLAASETMTRPQLEDLSPRFSYLDLRPGSLQAVAGNVNLEPYTSTNLDLSLEYYFGDINFITLAYFEKEVRNFIVNDTETVVVQTDVESVIDDPLVDEDGGSAQINVQRPLNSEVADVSGYEVAFQYAFDRLPGPFDGFGISGNATFLDSNADIDANSSVNTLFGLPGLGDSRNAALFYEKGPIEARIAWNWRDRFMESLINPKAGVEPVFVEEYEQVDAQFTYHINDSVAIVLEGTNILDESLRKHGRFEDQFILYSTTGPRYALGIRANF
jgi:TonB-dependent receptor